jgi:hypothetical protein
MERIGGKQLSPLVKYFPEVSEENMILSSHYNAVHVLLVLPVCWANWTMHMYYCDTVISWLINGRQTPPASRDFYHSAWAQPEDQVGHTIL